MIDMKKYETQTCAEVKTLCIGSLTNFTNQLVEGAHDFLHEYEPLFEKWFGLYAEKKMTYDELKLALQGCADNFQIALLVDASIAKEEIMAFKVNFTKLLIHTAFSILNEAISK
jgi:hypothetical protein